LAKTLIRKRSESRLSLSRSSSISSLSEKNPLLFIINDDQFYGGFKDFLEKCYAIENLIFYLEAAEFYEKFSERSEEQSKELAQRITTTFIEPGSLLEINVDDEVRENVLTRVSKNEIIPKLFQYASKAVLFLPIFLLPPLLFQTIVFFSAPFISQVSDLLTTDLLAKWKKTKSFNELWRAKGSPEVLSPIPYYGK